MLHCEINEPYNDSHVSSSGQDPSLEEMRSILVMSGPSFKKAKRFREVPQNIDIFPLMAKLLNIKETPPNSGSLDTIQKALIPHTKSPSPIPYGSDYDSDNVASSLATIIPLLVALIL
ncbi:hypothetical protein PFISCL1PPCAC_15850 [Pristionchus fissidentatus]|uniref:Uncharacterized protein n=1 Tax=Pristionchus fissidentatus TaxID=1538716 RepID=A0AAV5W257_9BILA|nr:hypothetical protein PFISCL1PPCAC_15850 [Pristionchus fissidentatus]